MDYKTKSNTVTITSGCMRIYVLCYYHIGLPQKMLIIFKPFSFSIVNINGLIWVINQFHFSLISVKALLLINLLCFAHLKCFYNYSWFLFPLMCNFQALSFELDVSFSHFQWWNSLVDSNKRFPTLLIWTSWRGDSCTHIFVLYVQI